MGLRWCVVVGLTAVGLIGAASVAQQAAGSAAPAAAASTQGVWAKLDQTLDTTFTKTGDKVTLALQADVTDGNLKLPKGTKLEGTVVKSQKQDKQHANAGVVLRFDTAVLKDKSTVPVQVVLASLAPSPSDQVEKVDVGSGQITDASMEAAKVAHEMDDPNGHASAGSSTRVNGIQATSSINGVVLFASPDSNSSGVIVEKAGQQLELHKWTRFDVVVKPR
jgi:hypothetical protein